MGEAYALSGDRRVRGNSGHAKKVTIRRILTLWRPQMVDQVRTRKKKGTRHGELTNYSRPQNEGQLRAQKKAT